ncbi:hypothetical protein PR048_023236 [Dryococelus australis]|uniref:Uncharacterized protein n=1 Tax=Dryococelus australis TaxID=614101 RepID=A0ABQ9GTH2_9NEOP|nr:hypothetical protein PR048_023236 [Dryococelus australis]
MKEQGKREIPEKTRRPAASSCTTCNIVHHTTNSCLSLVHYVWPHQAMALLPLYPSCILHGNVRKHLSLARLALYDGSCGVGGEDIDVAMETAVERITFRTVKNKCIYSIEAGYTEGFPVPAHQRLTGEAIGAPRRWGRVSSEDFERLFGRPSSGVATKLGDRLEHRLPPFSRCLDPSPPSKLTSRRTHLVLNNAWTSEATVAEQLACSPSTKAIRIQSPTGSLRIFACGNRAGRCLVSAGFLGDLPFPRPFIPPCFIPQSLSSALKTSTLRAGEISSLYSLIFVLSWPVFDTSRDVTFYPDYSSGTVLLSARVGTPPACPDVSGGEIRCVSAFSVAMPEVHHQAGETKWSYVTSIISRLNILALGYIFYSITRFYVESIDMARIAYIDIANISQIDMADFYTFYFQNIPPPHANTAYSSLENYTRGTTHHNRVQSVLLASHQGDQGSVPGRVTPDFRMWESCRSMPLVGGFSQGSSVSPSPSFRRYSITLIGSEDLDVKSRPNLFTHSQTTKHVVACMVNPDSIGQHCWKSVAAAELAGHCNANSVSRNREIYFAAICIAPQSTARNTGREMFYSNMFLERVTCLELERWNTLPECNCLAQPYLKLPIVTRAPQTFSDIEFLGLSLKERSCQCSSLSQRDSGCGEPSRSGQRDYLRDYLSYDVPPSGQFESLEDCSVRTQRSNEPAGRQWRRKDFLVALTIVVLRADEGEASCMEQCRNEGAGETGYPRENPPTSGIVLLDSHMRKSGVTRLGIEPGFTLSYSFADTLRESLGNSLLLIGSLRADKYSLLAGFPLGEALTSERLRAFRGVAGRYIHFNGLTEWHATGKVGNDGWKIVPYLNRATGNGASPKKGVKEDYVPFSTKTAAASSLFIDDSNIPPVTCQLTGRPIVPGRGGGQNEKFFVPVHARVAPACRMAREAVDRVLNVLRNWFRPRRVTENTDTKLPFRWSFLPLLVLYPTELSHSFTHQFRQLEACHTYVAFALTI